MEGPCSQPALLLVVDTDKRVIEAVRSCLPPPDYHCVPAETGRDALALLRNRPFSLALCAIRLADMRGVELLRHCLLPDRYPPFLMLGESTDWVGAIEAIRMGAENCLQKPLQNDLLIASVRQVLQRQQSRAEQQALLSLLQVTLHERTEHLQQALHHLGESHRNLMESLVIALDAREHETKLHSLRVQASGLLLAEKCGYSRSLLPALQHGALLHDIGKIFTPDAILLKPERLSADEMRIMRQHATHGHGILSRISYLQPAATVALCHHERVDGKGYPLKLAGQAIPLAARIFSVVDTLDAITAGRRYRAARTLEEARREIRRCAGSQFDKDVVDVFLAVSDEEWLAVNEAVASRYGSLYETFADAPIVLSNTY